MSFTRAALSGEASTLELLQRVNRDERPELVALYPNWFPFITSRFGREIDRVTIEHNVICGGPTKIIARADWSALDGDIAPANVLDEIDMADVDSELAHDYESPAPRGGWAVGNIRDGVFDGGRVVPAGMSESFVAHVDADVVLVMRSDEPIDARVNDVELAASRQGERWTEARAPLAVTRGARVVITRARAAPRFSRLARRAPLTRLEPERDVDFVGDAHRTPRRRVDVTPKRERARDWRLVAKAHDLVSPLRLRGHHAGDMRSHFELFSA